MVPTRTQPHRPWLLRRFQQVYDKQVDGLGLAAFRIVFSAVLLAEVAQLFYFRHLVFDVIPFVEASEIGATVPLLLWMGVLGLLILGWFTRLAALANYAFLVVIFASLKTYSYMMTPIYICLGFLFLFLPIGRQLSLDRLRQRLRYSTAWVRYEPPTAVSQLAYYAPVVVGLAFVYLDSALFKLASPMWLAGLGMWKPLSLAYETRLDGSILLNQEGLVKALGYFTLFFECSFLFLFSFRKCRIWLLLVGTGLHLGILLTLPVLLFSLGFGSLYLLLVPVGWWRRLCPPVAAPRLTFFYDADCPRYARVRLVIEHFDVRRTVGFQCVHADVHSVDWRGRVHQGADAYVQVLHAIAYLRPLAWLLRLPGPAHLGRAAHGFVAHHRVMERCAEESGGRPAPPRPDAERMVLRGLSRRDLLRAGAALGLAFLTGLQCVVSYNTALVQGLRRRSGLETTRVGRGLVRAWRVVEGPARNYFGIANHPIALDEHFAGYTRLVAVTYTGADGVERFLPMTRSDGLPGPYLSGSIWLKWTHLVVSHKIDQPRLEKGLRNFTAFWAHENGVDLDSCRFKVKIKTIAEASHWEPDFLGRQLHAPWHDAGQVQWRRQQFTAHLIGFKSP